MYRVSNHGNSERWYVGRELGMGDMLGKEKWEREEQVWQGSEQ
jgi:hypothetical protein